MVGNSAKPKKSRVIAGTPMYRFVNKIGICFVAVLGAYHVSINAYAYYSNLEEKYPQYLKGGLTQIKERGGVGLLMRESAQGSVKERFLTELDTLPPTQFVKEVIAKFRDLFKQFNGENSPEVSADSVENNETASKMESASPAPVAASNDAPK